MSHSQKGNKPKFSVMEYFILVLVAKTGLRSLYDFQQRAALQPGGIRSAMQRLERMKLLTRAESSVRRRRELALTDEGYRVLHKTWRECMENHHDADSLIRAAWVALMMGEPMYAAEYLEGNAGIRKFMEEDKTMQAERLGKMQKDPLSTYAWMRTISEARRRHAESEAFSLLSQFLREKYQPDVSQQR